MDKNEYDFKTGRIDPLAEASLSAHSSKEKLPISTEDDDEEEDGVSDQESSDDHSSVTRTETSIQDSSDDESLLEKPKFNSFKSTNLNLLAASRRAIKKLKQKTRAKSDERLDKVLGEGESVESLLEKFRELKVNTKQVNSLSQVRRKLSYENMSKDTKRNVKLLKGRSKAEKVLFRSKSGSDAEGTNSQGYTYKPSLLSKSLVIFKRAFD